MLSRTAVRRGHSEHCSRTDKGFGGLERKKPDSLARVKPMLGVREQASSRIEKAHSVGRTTGWRDKGKPQTEVRHSEIFASRAAKNWRLPGREEDSTRKEKSENSGLDLSARLYWHAESTKELQASQKDITSRKT